VLIHRAQLIVWKPDLSSFLLQELMIQSREEPRLDLGPVSKLMAFTRPGVESLLRQFTRLVFVSGQTECELIQRGIIPAHKHFKFVPGSHVTVIVVMSHR